MSVAVDSPLRVAADVADPLLTVDPDTPPSITQHRNGQEKVSIGRTRGGGEGGGGIYEV